MTAPSEPRATVIDPDLDVVTPINVFTLKPENQQAFLDTQHAEYQKLAGKIPGSVVANLHRGRGGTRAVNYARFQRTEDFVAWLGSDLMKQHMPVIAPYIERVAPGLYRLAHLAERDRGAARIVVGGVAVIAVMTVDPAALDDVLAAQRDAAAQLVREVPGARAIAIHRSIELPPGVGPGAGGAAPVRSALYAVVESDEAARALMEHAGYRAAFTTERAQLRAVDAEIYTVVAVE